MINIVIITCLFIVSKTVPIWLDSLYPEFGDNFMRLYWVLNSVIILLFTIFYYKKSNKSVLNLIITTLLLGILTIDILNWSYQIYDITFKLSNDWKYRSYFSISILFYVFIARKRYDWALLNSDKYDADKVQAIYSKPKTVLTLLGATFSLSPKCSIRYTYKDKTIRFKKGFKTPIMTDTIIKRDEIIKNTVIPYSYFYKRYEEIKNKKYNLLTFNCKMLF